MHRNVTAIYRTGEAAELVRRNLEKLGIPARDIHVIPDPTHRAGGGRRGLDTGVDSGIAPTGSPITGGVVSGDPAATAAHPLHDAGALADNAREDPVQSDRLHDLHLPEEDLRTYQHAVRQGDHVVSAEVGDAQLERVREAMRRPESEMHDIERRVAELRREDLIEHSPGEGRMTLSEEYRARRLTPGADDPFARIYERNRRLDRF